jgi:Tfp pilus assembly protein PilN
MININLIPKQYLKRGGSFNFGKYGVYAVVGVCGVVIMLGSVTMYQVHQMDELTGQMEIALIDIKAKITNRMEAVERLDRHRGAWVRILGDISRNVPEFVWLSSFAEVNPKPVAVPPRQGLAGKPGTAPVPVDTTANVVVQNGPIVKPAEIEGFTFTLNALASFMIKMMRSDYFDNVDLIYSKEIAFGKQKAYNFKLSCNVHYLSDEEVERLAQEAIDTTGNIN